MQIVSSYHCLVLLDFLSLDTNGSVVLGQIFCELLVGRLLEDGLLPQIRSQVGIGGGHSSVGCLGEVAEGSGGSTSGGVAVVDTGHLEQLLGNWSGDDTSSTWSGDESHPDGAALAGHLAGDGMGTSDLVTPEATSDGDDGELGEDDGTTDGGGDLLGALDTETNMTVVVSNGDKSLESGSLTSSGLLLDRHDLQNLILESRSNEAVNDLVLFDGKRVEVDLLQTLDLSILDQTSQFGDWDPVLLFLATSSTSTTTASAATASSTSPASISESSTETSSITTTGWSTVRHIYLSDISLKPEG